MRPQRRPSPTVLDKRSALRSGSLVGSCGCGFRECCQYQACARRLAEKAHMSFFGGRICSLQCAGHQQRQKNQRLANYRASYRRTYATVSLGLQRQSAQLCCLRPEIGDGHWRSAVPNAEIPIVPVCTVRVVHKVSPRVKQGADPSIEPCASFDCHCHVPEADTVHVSCPQPLKPRRSEPAATFPTNLPLSCMSKFAGQFGHMTLARFDRSSAPRCV